MLLWLMHTMGNVSRLSSVDQISSTLSSVLADTFKTSERTVFWDDERGANMDPIATLEGGFFAADWDLKVGLFS